MKLAAVAVHLLTGLGAVCALLAVEAILSGDWPRVFWWLGVAFLIDGIDGPIARAIGVKEQLPRFSGETIDLMIDYLTSRWERASCGICDPQPQKCTVAMGRMDGLVRPVTLIRCRPV